MVGHTLGILMVLAWIMELCQEPDEAVCNCIDLLEFVGGSQHATLLPLVLHWPAEGTTEDHVEVIFLAISVGVTLELWVVPKFWDLRNSEMEGQSAGLMLISKFFK